MHYDALLFVQAIRTKYWLGMLAAIDAALVSAARWPAGNRRAGPIQKGIDLEFLHFLQATRRYLLAEGKFRPDGLDDDQFVLLKPLCEHLVAQGRFPPERLQLFADLDPWRVPSVPDQQPLQRKERA